MVEGTALRAPRVRAEVAPVPAETIGTQVTTSVATQAAPWERTAEPKPRNVVAIFTRDTSSLRSMDGRDGTRRLETG